MVLALQKIESIEETNLLAGHVSVMFADYNGLFRRRERGEKREEILMLKTEAQRLFLSSSRPLTALEMRRDLLQWEQALTLAKTLAPDQLGTISREYAQQLEFKGEYLFFFILHFRFFSLLLLLHLCICKEGK
jgi:WD repeat-containing protein 19